MASNTSDDYVPKLCRHQFKAQGDQPAFSIGDTAGFQKSWSGYILVPTKGQHSIRVEADDNASFSLAKFSGKIAQLLPRDEWGGGNFEYCETVSLGNIKAGYYKVDITYTNIHYPGANLARLAVELDGTQITLGELETHNLWEQKGAAEFKAEYPSIGGQLSGIIGAPPDMSTGDYEAKGGDIAVHGNGNTWILNRSTWGSPLI